MKDDTREARALLRRLFDAAVDAANPMKAVARNLPPRPKGRTVVIGAGKAAIPMARRSKTIGTGPLEGFVVAPHGYAHDLKRIGVVHGSHPVPDETEPCCRRQGPGAGLHAGAGRSLDRPHFGRRLPPSCRSPFPEFRWRRNSALVRAVLKCGANISELNCVRKQISAVKGGRLARAAGKARIYHAGAVGRAGRRSRHHRLRADRCRRHAQGGCARHSGALPRGGSAFDCPLAGGAR